MTAYRIRACMGGQQLDHVVEAANSTEAILSLSEQVDQGQVEIIDDGFTGNKRIHITYEELNES
ncbi:hypothetical protein [Hyphomonas sp.]|uniref:hypothetical protein n=1 Tax=Hyphomonas sp. TaxID=87 RepID=UPI0025B8F517|nr:hypothetical protein [Hyphomonas sp.]|tara:strand:- start:413 stop:604 length:192 start_codon:yes stop_codon:yes gene_type:complete